MKMHGNITIAGKAYKKGDEASWGSVYPTMFFFISVYTLTVFLMTYFNSRPDVIHLFIVSFFSVVPFVWFYVSVFGLDEIKWMFINSLLGIVGIYTQMGWILSMLDKDIEKYLLFIHIFPFSFFVLLSFLLRHAFLDLVDAKENKTKKAIFEFTYVIVTVVLYFLTYYFHMSSDILAFL